MLNTLYIASYEGKRLIKKVARRIYATAHGIPKAYYKHQEHLDGIFLDLNKKVHLPRIDLHLSHACNLKCENCCNFSPFKHGIIPEKEVIDSIEKWSRRLAAGTVNLLGGEPFLHPNIDTIVAAARKSWGKSRIRIWTNGILVPKLEDRVLKILGANDIFVMVSQHLNTEQHNRDMKMSTQRFRKFGIKFSISKSYDGWMKMHQTDAEGHPIPWQSNPSDSYANCLHKHCTTIIGDQMCRCAVIINAYVAHHAKALKSDWNCISSPPLVSVEDPPEAILAHLRDGAVTDVCHFFLRKICVSSFIIRRYGKTRAKKATKCAQCNGAAHHLTEKSKAIQCAHCSFSDH